MAKRTCSVDGCERPHKAHSFCNPHLKRWQRWGDPEVTRFNRDPNERFWEYVTVDGDCWIWTGARGGVRNGYGKWSEGRRTEGTRRQQGAHRKAYELLVGPVDSALHLDHLCKRTLCVNPDHLEPVLPAENNRRSASLTSKLAKQVACHRGHPLTDDNVYRAEGKHGWQRRCRTCGREAQREYRRRLRGLS